MLDLGLKNDYFISVIQLVILNGLQGVLGYVQTHDKNRIPAVRSSELESKRDKN